MMNAGEVLLPSWSGEKRFNFLRAVAAVGHFGFILLFFLPAFATRVKKFDAYNFLGEETGPLSAMRDLAFNPDVDTQVRVFLGGMLLAHIAALVVPFIKPRRAVFVAGGVLGLVWLAIALMNDFKVAEATGAVHGVYSYKEAWVSLHPVATIVSVVASAATMLGFIIRPPMNEGLPAVTSSSAMSLPGEPPAKPVVSGAAHIDGTGQAGESCHPGPPRSLWVASGVVGLLLVGAAWATWRAHTPPFEVNFRNSVIGLGRVLVIRNQSMKTLEGCQIKVRNANGQSVGPIGLGEIGPGESKELGWAELEDWRLVPGETITLSSSGYADKTIVVP